MVMLHPRHCTEPVTIAPYTADEAAFAGTWSDETFTWLTQVQGRSELAINADGVRAHAVLTIRVPPTEVLTDGSPDGSDLAHDDPDDSARSLIDLVPPQSLLTYRGRQYYALALREVLSQGSLVYLEITAGDRAPLFGGWLVTDAVLERTGGRDPRGYPLPAEDIPIPEAVIRHVSSAETDRSLAPETTAELFLPPDAPTVTSTDRVRLPSGPMAGRYQVVGTPDPQPTRTVVQLRRL